MAPNDDFQRRRYVLLLVVLYDLRVADARRVRVLPGLAKGAALAEQVPALVE